MSKPLFFQFRLYVAGDGPHSLQAMANLQAICREYLAECHEIEIVDVLQEPNRALADGVMLTPLLVKLSPPPCRKLVGTLRERDLLLQALGITA